MAAVHPFGAFAGCRFKRIGCVHQIKVKEETKANKICSFRRNNRYCSTICSISKKIFKTVITASQCIKNHLFLQPHSHLLCNMPYCGVDIIVSISWQQPYHFQLQKPYLKCTSAHSSHVNKLDILIATVLQCNTATTTIKDSAQAWTWSSSRCAS